MPGFAALARQYSQEAAHDLHLARSRSTLAGGQAPSELPRSKSIPETSLDTSTSSSSSPREKRLSTGSNQETLAGGLGEKTSEKGVVDLEGQGEVDDETPKTPAPEDPFLVTLKGREHLNPHTWGEGYRWFLTGFAGLLVLNATFASSAPSNLIPDIIEHYNVSQEIGILLISIFVAGYVVGPLLWGPLSERYGRKKVFLIAFWPYVGFQIGCALSPNIGSLLVFRFLGGTFAASPLTNSGGTISDIWGPEKRGDALAIFSLMPFAGPALAPIVSGYMHVAHVDWRWVFWLLAIFAGVCSILISLVLPETYVPYLLYQEAKRLRKETGDERYHSALEDSSANESPKEVLRRTVGKPFIMIVQEPMLAVITLLMSFVYGIVYLLFEAIPIIFIAEHHLNSGEAGLVFLTLPVGGSIAVLFYIFYFNPQYIRLHRAAAPRAVAPEVRLRPLMFAAPAFAIAFFWIGWSSFPHVNIASPIIALTLLGAAILFIFLGCFNYLIDTYLVNAASCLSINTVCRSTLGAGFPLFAVQMFDRLGVPGACSLLGGLALLFVPMPFLLMKYGRKIREMSKNAILREES